MKGLRIVVTRPEAQAAPLVEPLRALGARVFLFPTIRIVPPRDPTPLHRSAREAAEYDWIVFTSVNGVDAFARALDEAGIDPSSLETKVRTCAIGPATGDALEAVGLRPRVIPDEFVAEAVVAALGQEADLEGRRILLPRAAVARSTLPEGLIRRGARVEVVEAYRTEPVADGADRLRELLDADEVDLITFTASSTVRSFHDAVGSEVGRAKVAAIGPITAATARDLGYDVAVVAKEYTIPGLVDACVDYVSAEGGAP